MAGFDQPNVLNPILDDVPAIREALVALAKMDPSTLSALAAQMKRIAEGADGYEIQMFNGQSWANIGKLNHDVASVDGFSASQTAQANAIAVRDKDGKLPGDILGNAATASKAAALSATNPISTGGTGATDAAQARNNLGTPPTNHASTGTTYGIGTGSNYGHVKVSDTPDASLAAAGGHALSPKGAKEALDKKLDTSGGTMTGTVKFTITSAITVDADNKVLNLFGGSAYKHGGQLSLFGIEQADLPGGFRLLVYNPDGTFYGQLEGSSNGLKWLGKHVLTSAGGTVQGNLFLGTGMLVGNNVNEFAIYSNTEAADRSLLVLRKGTHPEYPSRITMGCRNTGYPGINLELDARLGYGSINNKPILTSAGGTMTGNLAIENKTLILRDTTLKAPATTTTWSTSYVSFNDSTGGRIAFIQPKLENNGSTSLYICASHSDTTRHLYMNSDGTAYVNNSPILTIVASWNDDAGNWYRKYNDGWIEQGGIFPTSGGSATVSLNTPFSDTNYTITLGEVTTSIGSDTDGVDHATSVGNLTTTNFKTSKESGRPIRWRACGF